jgi:hypothetical protein
VVASKKGQPKRAKGSDPYDLLGQPERSFETMCCRLIRLDHPEVIRPTPPESGADLLLRGPDGGWERVWQVKHFSGSIRWDKCRESLDAAKARWKPDRYTFCFPRDLTGPEQSTFDKHFRSPDEGVDVDHWSGDRILAMLTGSAAGERVARTFFPDPDTDLAMMANIVRAHGDLSSTRSLLDRISAAAEEMSRSDAFFTYVITTNEVGEAEATPPPNTALSLTTVINEVIAAHIHAVPRDEEALERYPPEIRIETTPDERGQRAAQLIDTALHVGGAKSIPEGTEVVFENTPPGLRDFQGERLIGGQLDLHVPAPPSPPWNARLTVQSANGPVIFDVTLIRAKEPPDGFDVALVGAHGGLDVSLRFIHLGDGNGKLGAHFHFRPDDSSLTDRLAALRFLATVTATGEFEISDRGPTRREPMTLSVPKTELTLGLRVLLAFLEDVHIIADWMDAEPTVPDVIDSELAVRTARIAKRIRDGGQLVRWAPFEMTVTRAGLAQAQAPGYQLAAVQQLSVKLYDEQILPFGYTLSIITEYHVEVLAEHPDGTAHVRFSPPDELTAELFERMFREEPGLPSRRTRRSSARAVKRKKKKHGRRYR